MNYQTVRLKEEVIMYNRIFENLQTNEILELMKLGKVENQELIKYRKLMSGISLRVSADLTPELNKIFQNVISRLGYNKPLECYITNDSDTNGYSISLDFYNQPNVIILSSQLINTFEENEIEFIFGHEIGHLIIDEKRLGLVRNFIFDHNDKKEMKDKYVAIANEIKYLDNLIELSADRFGLIACKKLEVAISAIFKMYSGINIKKKFSFSQLFDNFEKELSENLTAISEDMLKNSSASTSFLNNDHPIYPIRILSIKYFSESKTIKKINIKGIFEDKILDENIDGLCEKLQVFDLDNDFIPLFLATAGIIIAELDGEITLEEFKSIEIQLSFFTLIPVIILEQVLEADDKKTLFEDSIKVIIENDYSKKDALLRALIHFALSDGFLHDKEKEFIFEAGEKFLNFSKEEIAYHIVLNIKEMYLEEKR